MTGFGALAGLFDDLERAGDALQLAAAVIACEERTGLLPFVTLGDPRGGGPARGLPRSTHRCRERRECTLELSAHTR